MKRLVLLVLGVAAVATGAHAQSNAELIEGALAAAPARARDAAAVIQWNADFTYETLKEGTNRIVCYHRSDEVGRPAFAVQCTSVANLERVAQSRRFRPRRGGTGRPSAPSWTRRKPTGRASRRSSARSSRR